jgi:hypothetical protein
LRREPGKERDEGEDFEVGFLTLLQVKAFHLFIKHLKFLDTLHFMVHILFLNLKYPIRGEGEVGQGDQERRYDNRLVNFSNR